MGSHASPALKQHKVPVKAWLRLIRRVRASDGCSVKPHDG